jgi:hypothetical protein
LTFARPERGRSAFGEIPRALSSPFAVFVLLFAFVVGGAWAHGRSSMRLPQSLQLEQCKLGASIICSAQAKGDHDPLNRLKNIDGFR